MVGVTCISVVPISEAGGGVKGRRQQETVGIAFCLVGNYVKTYQVSSVVVQGFAA